MVVAACGSSSSSSSSGAPTASGSTAACVTRARAATEKAEAPLTVTLPPGPIDLSKVAGKNVWLLVEIQNEFAQTLEAGFKAAAKAAGVTTHFYYGTGTVASWNAGVAQAVAAHADAILLFAINPGLVSAPLAAATAKHITIVDMFNGLPDEPLAKGVFAHITADWTADGVKMGNWALADSGCKLNAAIFSPSVLPILNEEIAGVKQTISSNCPSCKVSSTNVDLGTLSSSLGPQVTSAIGRDPNINYLIPSFDGLVPLVLPSVQGKTLKLVSHDGIPSSLNLIRQDAGENATAAQPPGEWMGWAMIDQLLRGMTGGKPANWLIPVRMIDKSNIGASNSGLWTGGWVTYPTKFVDIWRGRS